MLIVSGLKICMLEMIFARHYFLYLKVDNKPTLSSSDEKLQLR